MDSETFLHLYNELREYVSECLDEGDDVHLDGDCVDAYVAATIFSAIDNLIEEASD
jgi:hypothetical protein